MGNRGAVRLKPPVDLTNAPFAVTDGGWREGGGGGGGTRMWAEVQNRARSPGPSAYAQPAITQTPVRLPDRILSNREAVGGGGSTCEGRWAWPVGSVSKRWPLHRPITTRHTYRRPNVTRKHQARAPPCRPAVPLKYRHNKNEINSTYVHILYMPFSQVQGQLHWEASPIWLIFLRHERTGEKEGWAPSTGSGAPGNREEENSPFMGERTSQDSIQEGHCYTGQLSHRDIALRNELESELGSEFILLASFTYCECVLTVLVHRILNNIKEHEHILRKYIRGNKIIE